MSVESMHGTASPADMLAVTASARSVGLRGVELKSDRQPARLVIQNVSISSSRWAPMVVATDRPDGAAWILVTIDGTHWARLAYQFGHELGHVLCNSWGPGCEPQVPCQWIEEVCVEAFSIRTLFEMERRWSKKAPYPQWTSYSPDLGRYATGACAGHASLATKPNSPDYLMHLHPALTQLKNLGEAAKAVVPEIVEVFRRDPQSIADLGALNRWPGRAKLPISDYLSEWAASCSAIGTPGRLPGLFNCLAKQLL